MKIDMIVFGGVARVPRAAPTTTTATRSDESDIVQSAGYLTVAESNDGSKSGTACRPPLQCPDGTTRTSRGAALAKVRHPLVQPLKAP